MIAWLRSLWALASDYEGPAKVEVFGHDEHVGWVRSTAERIYILTSEGAAIQIDARARFRLTPITWQELTYECLKQKSDLAYIAQKHREQIRDLDERVEAAKDRIGELREVMTACRVRLSNMAPNAPITDVLAVGEELERALAYDDDQDKDAKIPF